MPQCQCLTKTGKQCLRQAMTKKGSNPLYCGSHQMCQSPMIQQPKVRSRAQPKPRARAQPRPRARTSTQTTSTKYVPYPDPEIGDTGDLKPEAAKDGYHVEYLDLNYAKSHNGQKIMIVDGQVYGKPYEITIKLGT